MKTRIVIIIATTILILFNSCERIGNRLKLNFDAGINKTYIKVSMEVLTSIPITVIFDGEKEYLIPNGYGENEWYFVYKDSLRGYFRHIKTNRNDTHAYEFKFYQENQKFFVDIEITGDSPLKKKLALILTNKTSKASQ